MTIVLSPVVSRNEAIVFTGLDDAIVMMDVDEGRYYELDPFGARIRASVETARPVAGICNARAGGYEVDPGTGRRDTPAFLQSGGAPARPDAGRHGMRRNAGPASGRRRVECPGARGASAIRSPA